MSAIGWLIEIPGPHPSWWDGRGPSTFTTDPLDVLRLARREDAERLLAWKVCVPPPGEVRITEHQWGFGGDEGANPYDLSNPRHPAQRVVGRGRCGHSSR